MTIGRSSGGAMRIAARMANLVQEARIIHAAGLAIERGIGGARERDGRFDAARNVDAGQNDPLKDASESGHRRSAELPNRLRQAPERERFARAGGPQDRR